MIRPLNGLIAVFTLVPAVALGSGKLMLPVRVAIASFLIASFGYVINDLFDFRADKINKPNRVIPARLLSAWDGINIAIFCFVLGFAAIASADRAIIFFFAIIAVSLFLYSFKISSILILSNVWAAMMCSSAFYLGGLITAASPANWGLLNAAMTVTFLYHLGREVIKDIEDCEGDRFAGRKTIPLVCGKRGAGIIAAAVFSLMIAATYVTHFHFHFPNSFLIIVSFAVNLPIILIFAFLVFRDGAGNIRRASSLLKAVMIPALIALLVAGLNQT